MNKSGIPKSNAPADNEKEPRFRSKTPVRAGNPIDGGRKVPEKLRSGNSNPESELKLKLPKKFGLKLRSSRLMPTKEMVGIGIFR